MNSGLSRPGQTSDHARLDRARRRLVAVEGFYIHLAIFALIMTGLLVLDWATGEGWWVHWVCAGWGIGLAAHGRTVFARSPAAVRHWEQRKMREYMRGR